MKLEVIETPTGKRFLFRHERGRDQLEHTSSHLFADPNALGEKFTVTASNGEVVEPDGIVMQSHHELFVFHGLYEFGGGDERLSADACKVGWTFEFTPSPPANAQPWRDYDRNLAATLFGFYPYYGVGLALYEAVAETA